MIKENIEEQRWAEIGGNNEAYRVTIEPTDDGGALIATVYYGGRKQVVSANPVNDIKNIPPLFVLAEGIFFELYKKVHFSKHF